MKKKTRWHKYVNKFRFFFFFVPHVFQKDGIIIMAVGLADSAGKIREQQGLIVGRKLEAEFYKKKKRQRETENGLSFIFVCAVNILF